MSAQTAKITFIVYSILTGLTFSSIFVAFNIQTIVYAFGITSFIFMIFSIIGYTTNIDLTKMGTYLFVALIVLILGSIFSIFIDSSALDFYMVIFGILLFIGFVAYDIQKIKKMMYHIEDEEKVAIYGALHLYLDFINLFIRILSLLARNKN